jgi:hypothetical protein
MKTKNYFKIKCLTFIAFFLSSILFVNAFEVTKSVLAGAGQIELFKNGKKVIPTTEFASGDTLIVFASPSENESLSFIMIGDDIFYSSPILVRVNSNINIQVGFEAKRILFKETFGKAEVYVSQLGGGVDANAYTGYDTSSEVAVISTIDGKTNNSKIHNNARNTNADDYDPSNADNPHTTHVYLQNSNMAIKFAEGKELVGDNMQIKFRHTTLFAADRYYDYDRLLVRLNNTAFTPLEYGNSVQMPVFWNNIENPNDPESTGLNPLTTYLAPFVVIPVPENYPKISSIMIIQQNATAPFMNRSRVDDIIIVADGDPSSVDKVSIPSIFAVITDFDIEFRGSMKIGEVISIYNLSGTIVKSQLVTSDRVLISTSDLPAGLYVASVKDKHGEVNSFKVMLN